MNHYHYPDQVPVDDVQRPAREAAHEKAMLEWRKDCPKEARWYDEQEARGGILPDPGPCSPPELDLKRDPRPKEILLQWLSLSRWREIAASALWTWVGIWIAFLTLSAERGRRWAV